MSTLAVSICTTSLVGLLVGTSDTRVIETTLYARSGCRNPGNPGFLAGKITQDAEGGVSEKLSLDDASPDRVAHEPGRVVDLELGHDPRPVGLRGPGADAQELGDLLGGLAFGHELQDLALAVGQVIARERRLAERRLDDDPRDSGAEIDRAPVHLLDRANQLF